MRRITAAIAALTLALLIAGCGGSGSGGSGAYGSSESAGAKESAETSGSQAATSPGKGGYSYSSPAAAGNSSGGGGGPIAVASVGDIGSVLVDSSGLTLYYFERDQGGESSCYGKCASAWPPLASAAAPQAGEGVDASKLGTTTRKDGETQVTYAGWPLYTYAGDSAPGQDNGTDLHSFGAAWYPLHPDGQKAGD